MKPSILDTISILPNLEYHVFDGNIGINVSGGADSALLLFLTMKYYNTSIKILTLGNNQRHRKNVKAAMNVVERCIQLTGNTNITHNIHYTEIQNYESLSKMISYHRKNNDVDVMLGGRTQNPPKDITDRFKLGVTEDDRNPDVKQSTIIRVDDKIVGYKPFVNTNKKIIASLYEKYDLVDKLFSITRSCEYDPTSEYFNNIKDPEMGHCGKCWWCEERKWAFGRLE